MYLFLILKTKYITKSRFAKKVIANTFYYKQIISAGNHVVYLSYKYIEKTLPTSVG